MLSVIGEFSPQVGYDLTKAAADAVFLKSGESPCSLGGGLGGGASRRTPPLAGHSRDDVDVVELHDCFSTNELITYEALGLCQPGTVLKEATQPVVTTRGRGRVGVGLHVAL